MPPFMKLPSATGIPHDVRTVALACAASLLLGCATTTHGPAFVDAPKPLASDGLATVYFYRTGNWNANYGNTRLFINGKEVATLKEDGYTWVQLEPGKHAFEENLHWSLRPIAGTYAASTMQATVVADETYYIAIDITATNIKTVDTVTMVMIGDIPVPVYGKETTGDDTVAIRFETAQTGLGHIKSKRFQAHDY